MRKCAGRKNIDAIEEQSIGTFRKTNYPRNTGPFLRKKYKSEKYRLFRDFRYRINNLRETFKRNSLHVLKETISQTYKK